MEAAKQYMVELLSLGVGDDGWFCCIFWGFCANLVEFDEDKQSKMNKIFVSWRVGRKIWSILSGSVVFRVCNAGFFAQKIGDSIYPLLVTTQ